MKKVLLTLVLCLTLLVPVNSFTKADSNDKINIYLFRGYGCGYCHRFLEFLNSIDNEYGKYYNLVSYEVWYDENNYNLMMNISNFLNNPAGGVPYIIIGDQVFGGYASSYDDKIKDAIKKLYDTKKEDRYDVFKEYQKSLADGTFDASKYESKNADEVWQQELIGKYSVESTSEEVAADTSKTENYSSKSTDLNPWIAVAINFGIALVAATSIIYIVHGENKALYKRMTSIENELKELKNKEINNKEENKLDKKVKSKSNK